MIWDQLTSEQLGSLGRNIPVVLPLAATEQHGPHLPVATDRLIGEHFAQKLHESIPDQVLILPAVGVGCSDHHMDFSGTLTLSHQAFMEQVEGIVQSVAHHGFSSILFLNSHGGNQGIAQVLVEKLGYKYSDCQFVITSWWQVSRKELLEITETGFGGVGHAGEFETSLMLLIAPELVRSDKIIKGDNQPTYPWASADMLRGAQASYYRTMKQLTPNGTFGDPTAATVEKGQQITSVVIARLQQIISDLTHK